MLNHVKPSNDIDALGSYITIRLSIKKCPT